MRRPEKGGQRNILDFNGRDKLSQLRNAWWGLRLPVLRTMEDFLEPMHREEATPRRCWDLQETLSTDAPSKDVGTCCKQQN